MARTRDLRPGFFKNEQLCELPFANRLLFAGLWVIADRSGRLEDRPKRIHAELFPYDPDLNVDVMLEELDKRDFIYRYILNENSYIQIAKWHIHQHPHPKEPESCIPPIPFDLSDSKACRDFSGTSRVISGTDRVFPSIPSCTSDTPPIVPLKGDGDFSLQEPPTGKPKRPRKNKRKMAQWQREKFVEFMRLHPKSEYQVATANKVWAEKVTNEGVLKFVMDRLEHEMKGDTTYMLGSGKWLQAAITLYELGLTKKPEPVRDPGDLPEWKPNYHA